MNSNNFFESFSAFMTNGDTKNIRNHLSKPQNHELLNIYRNGFFKSSTEALSNNFPTVVSLLGEEFFKSIAKKFVRETPPKLPSLTEYGEDFPNFLHDNIIDIPYIKDFAILDHLWLKSLNESDDVGMSTNEFQQLLSIYDDIDQRNLKTVGSLQLFNINHPITSIWAELKQNAPIEKQTIRPDNQTGFFYKLNEEVNLQIIPESHYCFLQALQKGGTLAESSEKTLKTHHNFDLSDLFALCLEKLLLKKIENNSND